MQASPEQIVALTKLQHIDLECARLNKELDELPQKQRILEARKKKAAIEEKRRTVLGMRKDAETKQARLLGEDADLQRKQDLAQELINQAAADYRSVAAHSKELEEYAARRDELSTEIAAIAKRVADISKLEGQMDVMLSTVEEQEKKFTESYRYEGGELLKRISALTPERDQLAELVGVSIMAAYNRVAKAKHGVALAALNGNACNTCRSTFDPSRVLALRAEAPLATCPSCGRLMVVDKRYDG